MTVQFEIEDKGIMLAVKKIYEYFVEERFVLAMYLQRAELRSLELNT